MAFPLTAPYGTIYTRSPSPPRLGNYSSAAGHEHGVGSSDSNPSSSQSAGKLISDHEQLRSTPYVCVYPRCGRQFARPYDLDRHVKIHFPHTTRLDSPHGMKVGSFCKRVGERGFTRKDHLHENLRKVHFVNLPKPAKGMRASLNNNRPSKGKIEQYSKKDTTSISALATAVEPQQDEESQPKLEGDLNDEAMTVSSSGSSNPEGYAFSNTESGSDWTQLTSVSDGPMIPAVGDSRDMTGVASQLTSECVAKEALKVQPSDTPPDAVVLSSQNGIVSEQQTPSRACNLSDAPLPRLREIGQGSHPSGHEEAETAQNALEGLVAKEEAAFDSAVFQYRKAKMVLRQLPRIHKNGDSNYRAKLHLLLAKAYQGQGQLEKAKGSASVSLYERQDLHGKTHPLVEESAELLIAILIELGNYLEADAFRKVYCPRQPYTAAFVGPDMKVGTMAKPLRCSMILRRSLSILEHTQQWFLNSKLLSLLVHTVFPEKPLAAGKTRVRWTCSCGQRLFDDFIETRPGAAEELRVALDTFDRQRPTSHYPAYPAASYQSYSGSTNMSGNPTRDSATSPAGAIDPNFTPPRSIYDPPPTSGGLFSTNLRRDEPPESKWLLICAQAWRQPTSLLQLDVCSTTSDKQLFRDLRQSYLELKRAWWHRLSLKVVQSIRFVQFELHPSDLVDVRKVPDMPPAERHDEYLYQRVELIPPIGENMMTHWFHKPHKANDQAITFMRSPKKRKLRLAICPQMGTNIGWGIQLVEGWAMFKLWLLALVISFLGGMVFAVTWTVMKRDIQGAVAVAAYLVALAGLGVGTVQAYLH